MDSPPAPAPRDPWKDLYDIIESSEPFEEKTRRALRLGTEYLGADRGLLVRTDPDSGYWEAVVSTDPPDEGLHEGLELALDTTYCRRVIQTESQVTLHDAPNQGWGDDPAFETHGYYCYLGTPVYLRTEPYGTVCFYGNTPREEPFTTEEQLFAELVTRLIERELEQAEFSADITDKTDLAATLARVLRHNIRNSLTIVRGYTRELETHADENEYADVIFRELDSLLKLSEQARRLEHILTKEDHPTQTNIVPVVEKLAEAAVTEHPAASVSIDAPDEITLPIRPTLETALEEVLENAIQHSGDSPTVAIEIERIEKVVEIRIRDDGPGLPEIEQTALKADKRTPLTHGIGLGLWMVSWIVSRHDGTVEATVTDEGTTITITLPVIPETTEQPDRSKISRARDQYRAAFDEANDGQVIFNEDARVIDVNPVAAEIYGSDRQELIGRTLGDFLPEDYDFEAAWAQFQETASDTEADFQDDIIEIVGDDGQRRVVEYSVVTHVVPGQHLLTMQPFTADGYANVYEEIFNQTYQFTGLMKPDGTLLEANETALAFGGLVKDDVLGKKMWDAEWFQESEETQERARSAVERAARGEFVRETLTVRGADRDAIIDFSIRPITDDQGNVRLLIPEGRDVTEQRANVN